MFALIFLMDLVDESICLIKGLYMWQTHEKT